jgi:hypothetical protein
MMKKGRQTLPLVVLGTIGLPGLVLMLLCLSLRRTASEVKQQKPKQGLYDEEAAPPFQQKGEESWSHADDASVSNSGHGSSTKLGENKEVCYEFFIAILHYYTSTIIGSTSISTKNSQTKSCQMGQPRKMDGRRTHDMMASGSGVQPLHP